MLKSDSGRLERYWRRWAKALGTKEGSDNREADIVAVIRTFILLGYMVTNVFICAGVIRHWNKESMSLCDVNSVSVYTKYIKK